jgi:hypothetical protein
MKKRNEVRPAVSRELNSCTYAVNEGIPIMRLKLTQHKHMEFVILLLVSTLVYLPYINHLGYYKDDWYLMYSAYTQGPEIFREIFSIDRPARGELLTALYWIFRDNALYYNLSAYVFRLLSAFGFLWATRIIWPDKRATTLVMTVLFLIYPGYLSQVNAIDFQSHNISLFLAVFSIALSLQAISIKERLLRYGTILISILMGWAYLGLMEHAIGLEVFRFCCFYIFVSRKSDANVKKQITETIKEFLIYFAIPAGFLFWRLFIFQNDRRATDASFQFGELLASPLLTSFRWGIYTLQDVLNVTLLAWGVPLYNIGFQLRVRDSLIGIGIAALVLLIVSLAISSKSLQLEAEPEGRKEGREAALWIGLLTVLASIAPVIAANRHITFSEYSRYALPGSIGSALVISSLLSYLNSPRVRIAIIYGLIATAVLTHHGNVVQAVNQFRSVKEFWWQVSWRVPQIKEGTTLAAHYAESGIPESYMVWGPANIIYYPEKHSERPYRLALPAIILTNDNIAKITIGTAEEESFGRGWALYPNYKTVLVISQPKLDSCVRVLNGELLEISRFEDYGVMLVAGHSDISNILDDEDTHLPPGSMFGNEPKHDWCYYFQKADLARQSGNWNEVVRLRNELQEKGFHPNDQIEWIPFLQAYAILGDEKQVTALSKFINTDKYYKYQACQIMMSTETKRVLSPDMEAQIQKLFC